MGKKLSKNVPVLRFPEFEGDWTITNLGKASVFYDSQRIPLSSEERHLRQGIYPYYGASGIIDYIDDYIFDGIYILLAEDGANIINRSTPIAFIAEGRFWVNNHAHILKSKGSDEFLAAYLENLRYDRYNTGTAQPKLNAEICKNIIIKLPKIEEQEKIASFLGAVDRRLTQLRRKRELLQTYKRGVMQKIFSQEIRFKQDDGSDFPNWEETKLGEIFDFKNGINADKAKYGRGKKFINVLDIINDAPIYHDSIIGSVEITDQEFENNDVRHGDILFQRSSEIREEAGQSNVYLDRDKKATFGGFVIRGRPKISFNPVYFHNLLKTEAVRKEITDRSGGSTRFNVGQDSLRGVPIVMCRSIEEQAKIADFLTTIDRKVETLSRQIDQTEQFKKGLLQKMFV